MKAPTTTVPAHQRATDVSLRSRLSTALERNKALAERTPGYGGGSPARSATSAPPEINPVTITTTETVVSTLRVSLTTLSTTRRRRSQPRPMRKLKIKTLRPTPPPEERPVDSDDAR